MIGVNQQVYNIQEFQTDTFYMKVCELLFPEVSFEAMSPGITVDQMADNINAIIDYIEEIAPEIDLADLDGYMVVTGDLQSLYTFLSLIHNLIIITLEEEEEEDDALQKQQMMQEEQNQQKFEERQKERELQEKQLLEDPTALPVGNVRDLLKKKKKNKDIIQHEEVTTGVAKVPQANPTTHKTAKNVEKSASPAKISKQVDDIWKNLEDNQGLDDYLQDESDFDLGGDEVDHQSPDKMSNQK